MTVRTVQGADPAYPAPAELAQVITPPATTGTGAGQIQSRVKPPTPAARPWIQHIGLGNVTPAQSSWRQTVRDLLGINNRSQAAYDRYMTKTAREAIADLARWLREQMANDAAGRPIGQPDTPTDDGTRPMDAGTRRDPPPEIAPPTNPQPSRDNIPPQDTPKPYPAMYPPYTIAQSAYRAALWLAEVWGDDAAAQGYAAFVAARKAEIIGGAWNPRYWRELDKWPPQACVSTAHNNPDPDWDVPPFNDPERRRSITTYGLASTPYPLPPLGTRGAQPYPGYLGTVAAQHLEDRYVAAHVVTWQLGDDYDHAAMPPVFADVRATYHVASNLPPSRIQFAALLLPILYHDSTGADAETLSTPVGSRFYNWTTPIAPGGASPYTGSMSRHFVADLNIAAMVTPNASGQVNTIRAKLSPAAAWGKYFGDASDIATDYEITLAKAYLPKYPDSAYDATEIEWWHVWADAHAGLEITYTDQPFNFVIQGSVRSYAYNVFVEISRPAISSAWPCSTADFPYIILKGDNTSRLYRVPAIMDTQNVYIQLGSIDSGSIAHDWEAWSKPDYFNQSHFGSTAGEGVRATLVRIAGKYWRQFPGYLDTAAILQRLPQRL